MAWEFFIYCQLSIVSLHFLLCCDLPSLGHWMRIYSISVHAEYTEHQPIKVPLLQILVTCRLRYFLYPHESTMGKKIVIKVDERICLNNMLTSPLPVLINTLMMYGWFSWNTGSGSCALLRVTLLGYLTSPLMRSFVLQFDKLCNSF